MLTRLALVVMVAIAGSAAPALAQDHRVEVSVLAGWAFASGVDGNPVVAPDGNIYDRITPKDSLKWGLSGGVYVTDDAEVGFQFGQQQSTLRAVGTNTFDIGDMNVNTYHGYFAYNFLNSAYPFRPYLLVGAGATNFGSVDYTRLNGQPGTIRGVTRFSTTWGAGVKIYSSQSVGARFGVQWTPTPVKSDASGWWCDPYWGCYIVGNTDYSHQFDISGGISFRF